MKFIRLLLAGLGLVIGLLAVVALLAFIPAVQTGIAREEIGGWPGAKVSLGSFFAGWETITIADLRVETGDAVLTVPKIRATVPVKTALWDRRWPIRRVVAKGWTLDFTPASPSGNGLASDAAAAPPADDTGEAVLAPRQAARFVERTARRMVRDVFSRSRLPAGSSLDEVELEGDVIVPGREGAPPGRIHLIIKGGGLAAGREGDFAIDAAIALVTPGPAITHVTTHGQCSVGFDSSGAPDRFALNSAIAATGGVLRQNFSWTLAAALRRRSDQVGEYSLDLGDGGRHLLAADGIYSRADGRITGTWRIDLRDSDAAPFKRDLPNAGLAATGDGRFETDTRGGSVHVTGRVDAVASQPAAIIPQVKNAGPLKLNAQFDASRNGGRLKVDRLSATLAGERSIVELRCSQPFDFDEKTRALTAGNPEAGLARVSLSQLPLSWFANATGAWGFTAGTATGGFDVRAAAGGFSLRPTAPLTATGVSLRHRDGIVVTGLDLSLSASADYAPSGWHAEIAPLSVEVSGRSLAELRAKLSGPAGAIQPVEMTGTWKADLDVLAARAAASGLRWIRGRTASGDFAGGLGGTSHMTGQVSVTGHDPTHTLTAKVQADTNEEGTVDFLAPVRIAMGPKVSEITAEGNWSNADGDNDLALRLASDDAQFDQLLMITASIAGLGGAAPFEPAGAAQMPLAARDRMPFWGDWVGSLSLDFKRLQTRDRDYFGVGGVLNFDHDSVKSIGGHLGLSRKSVIRIDGSIAFDPDTKSPYTLAAKVACGEADPALLLPKPNDAENPAVEGKFAVTDTVTGAGAGGADLFAHMREEFQITSHDGIVRLLKSDVGQAMPPDPESRFGDAADAAGSFLGWLAGVKKGSIGSGVRKLPPATEAVLDFDNDIAEIGYDHLAITAQREADGTIRLATIDLTAPDEHVTASGAIAPAGNAPLRSRPLSVDLIFGVRGAPAKSLARAGLLSAKKDELGYTLLEHPVHFGGTLERIDRSAWVDLLLAAARKPAGAKKGG
ncbi:MAG TPA: hypothetical protein VG710_08620 [Opitutus sp.]|nr:hypothetical protein [Opitutus sp.]